MFHAVVTPFSSSKIINLHKYCHQFFSSFPVKHRRTRHSAAAATQTIGSVISHDSKIKRTDPILLAHNNIMKFVQPSSIVLAVLAVLAGSAVAFSPAGPRNSGRGFATPNIVSMSTKEIESSITEETSDSSDSDADSSISPEFAAARDQVVGSVRATIESEATASLLVHFTNEYFSAASASFNAGNEEYTPQDTAKRFSKALELGMKYGMEDKFLFDVAHKAIREGVEGDDKEDFYKFGCEFFMPAMDLENSEVLGEDNAKKAFEQIKAGENVVFLANHQSEADPQVFSVLLDKIGFEAESPDIVYVAGHKVTTDSELH